MFVKHMCEKFMKALLNCTMNIVRIVLCYCIVYALYYIVLYCIVLGLKQKAH